MNVSDVNITRCHRLYQTSTNGDRNIIVYFQDIKDRDLVWMNRFKLQGSKIFISEHFPPEIEDRRKPFYPVIKQAKKIPEFKDKIHLAGDSLYVNRKKYTVENIRDLPKAINPTTLAENHFADILGFFTEFTPLSNFFRCNLTVDGILFNCVEQAYSYFMCIRFGDTMTANEILASKVPLEQKRLTRKIKGFDEAVWQQEQDDVMRAALFAKFSQNENLKDYLLKTEGKRLAEASKNKYWGIGFPLGHDNVPRDDTWQGRNKLGELLESVREQLSC
jgi:ribA/ribD-fused uncharacterized protein